MCPKEENHVLFFFPICELRGKVLVACGFYRVLLDAFKSQLGFYYVFFSSLPWKRGISERVFMCVLYICLVCKRELDD